MVFYPNVAPFASVDSRGWWASTSASRPRRAARVGCRAVPLRDPCPYVEAGPRGFEVLDTVAHDPGHPLAGAAAPGGVKKIKLYIGRNELGHSDYDKMWAW